MNGLQADFAGESGTVWPEASELWDLGHASCGGSDSSPVSLWAPPHHSAAPRLGDAPDLDSWPTPIRRGSSVPGRDPAAAAPGRGLAPKAPPGPVTVCLLCYVH